jgi:hypothetical protein
MQQEPFNDFRWLFNMVEKNYSEIFSQDALALMFPKNRSNSFFDALYGDPTEGAYDISLEFKGHSQDKLHFEFHLKERPGKCLACNVTYGLPQVFSRHPIIDIKGVVQEIDNLLDSGLKCRDWQLGRTREVSRKLHIIPLTINME